MNIAGYFVMNKKQYFGIAITCMASSMVAAGPVENAPKHEGRYFCGIAKFAEVRDGAQYYGELPDQQSRPFLFAIPMIPSADLIAEGFSENGEFYSYIRKRGEGLSSHMINGSFDLTNLTLSTSRSAILPTNGHGHAVVAGSFLFKCTPVE